MIPRRLGHLLRALPPPGRGHRPAQRRAHPRRRHRPDPRRPRQLPGARGQPALAVRGVLRDGEPAHHGAGFPEPVRHPPGARRRRLRLASAAGAAQLRGHQRGRPDRRRPDPGRVQLGLLRAFAAGPPDGRRAGRGPRPVLPRQPGVHAHHRGGAPGRRHLPAHRRRLPGPDAVPARLGARGGRPAQRRPRRQRRDLQRGRQRRRRRQTRLHLRADHDRVLPGRETAAGQRRHLPLLAGRRTRRGARPDRRTGDQAGRGLRRLRHRVRSGSLRERAGRHQQEDSRRSARLDRAADDAAVDGADPDRRHAGAPLRRPAAVRGQRRRRRVGAAGRADPRRAGRGFAGGQLQPGRRLQGHLGAGVARFGGRPRAGRRRGGAFAAEARARPGDRRIATVAKTVAAAAAAAQQPRKSSPSNRQQQQQQKAIR